MDSTVCITHFAFSVDSTEFSKIQTYFKKIGLNFDGPEDTGIAYSIFCKDPDENSVEITTYHN